MPEGGGELGHDGPHAPVGVSLQLAQKLRIRVPAWFVCGLLSGQGTPSFRW